MIGAMNRPLLASALLALLLPSCASAEPAATQRASAAETQSAAPQPAPAPAPPPVVTPRVVARFPHDPDAFTQGLLWHDGALYESTGQREHSEIREVRLEDGHVLRSAAIPRQEFGEGLALWQGELISLTWQAGVAHRWALKDFKPKGEFHYDGEGWGLTDDGASLILSDGSPILRFLDPETFAERSTLLVHMPDGRVIPQLNELEYVGGNILANVWQTPFILRIDPKTGLITQVIDCRAIVGEIGATDANAVLNGIAWDAEGQRLFITGKLWPTLFEVTLPGAE
ncbi:glutaminyl-peptide cyclotransferase [Novosphingopyxis sp.]|uniref:glutaminyl-peptide cyclotransferase n=1 Tax=Novosphingopyxis sp. TaxID=2709690 RepID=UPI003B5991B4